ncbi:MAG: hypothetical protein Q9199_002824 [Rusavskia elegans]
MSRKHIPSDEAGDRLRLNLPFFDCDQFNYIVALKRADGGLSFQDLTTSFNARYKRGTNTDELEGFFKEAERAARGEQMLTPKPEHVDIIKFWPVDGFRPDETHKLFILATFREAYEAYNMIENGIPRPKNSNLRAAKKDSLIPYEDLRGCSSQSLMAMYKEIMKERGAS